MSKEKESASASSGWSPEGDWRDSRRAARWPGPVVGETQVCSCAATAAWGRPRDTDRANWV